MRLKPLGHPSDNANQYEKSERQYSVGVPRYNPARHALRRAAKSRVPGRWPPALRHSAAMKDRATPLDLSWWTPVAKHGAEPIRTLFVISAVRKEAKQEDVMGRGLLLWLLGIPIPIIILIWVLGGLHG